MHGFPGLRLISGGGWSARWVGFRGLGLSFCSGVFWGLLIRVFDCLFVGGFLIWVYVCCVHGMSCL